MKRLHGDDQTESVFSARRGAPYQHPVLAPAGVGLGHPFDRLQEGIARQPQFGSPHLGSSPGPSSNPQGGGGNPTHNLGQVSSGVHVQPQYTTHVQTPQPSQVQAGQQHFQRLKVEDALSYLDQVKLQFGNQPQVYNEFLDIMKEFKSQSIDTPGVISRVSTLFKGHPDLIVGFNTFLPPGYKIEVNIHENNAVSVCGPGQTHTILPQSPPPVHPKPPAHGMPTNNTNVGFGSSKPPQQSAPPSAPPQQQNQQPPQHPPHGQNQHQPSLPSPNNQSQTQQHNAINYVTKIKNRFQEQPGVYQKFLDILNSYQTEQKAMKESASGQFGRPLSEQELFMKEGKLANEVYQQVAKLFQNQEDLLQEFSQFLPDANGVPGTFAQSMQSSLAGVPYTLPMKKQSLIMSKSKQHMKKSSSGISMMSKHDDAENSLKDLGPKVIKKKHRSALKDVTLAEAVKVGSFSEFAFFDKVRKALKSQEVYENFLRCLVLFNQEILSRSELIQVATTFLGKFPDLFSWFKMFLGYKENQQVDSISGFKDRGTGGELAHLDIDYASCKRSGASYRALPKSYTQPKCSGRTPLCKEVLNDTWVSLPSWSEDTQFPGTRKTQYEEYIYKCEDERFELDVVIETNLSAIKVLDTIQKKLSRMSSEEQQKFRLDNSLGGTSEVIYKKAIYRIYGDKAPEIIDGLKKTPHIAVPLVAKRLKLKDEEWREAQKQFNKIWREQNEKYYLKSLDHQGIYFKQTDVKAMRSKMLIQDIEHIFEERSYQAEDGNAEMNGPHLAFLYEDKSILDDASSLIAHHMRRQAGIHKDDKVIIKQLLYNFIPDMFFAPRADFSDDECIKNEEKGVGGSSGSTDLEDCYNVFFVNNTWYIFLRLHQMLCQRLLTMYQHAIRIAENEAIDRKMRKEATAVALRLKKPEAIDLEEYYPAFLEMVRNLLDGNMESNTFEDSCREMFGVHAYISFTIDKLIQNIVRQLHTLVTDASCMQITETFRVEQSSVATRSCLATETLQQSSEVAYQRKVETVLAGENCFKFVFYNNKGVCKMSIELLATDDDQSEDPIEVEKWSQYVEKFVGSDEVMPELKEHLCKKPIFLLRTRRRKAKQGEGKGDAAEERKDNFRTVGIADEDYDVLDDVIIDDRLECKLSVNSYKMVYVAGTEDFMYHKGSLSKSKKSHPSVNTKRHYKFSTQHSQWVDNNATREQSRLTDDWLMGKYDEAESTITNADKKVIGGIKCNIYSVKFKPIPTDS